MHRTFSVAAAPVAARPTHRHKLPLALLAATSMAAHAEWQVLKTERGMQLQARSVAGERLRELRVETPTQATPEQLSAYLLGPYLDQPGEGIERRFIGRSATHAEWTDRIRAPVVSLRCATTRMDLMSAPASAVTSIRFESVDRGPAGQPQGCVPLRTRGSWELIAAGGGSGSTLRYTVFTDLGGSVPAFLVRGALEADAMQRAERVAQEAGR